MMSSSMDDVADMAQQYLSKLTGTENGGYGHDTTLPAFEQLDRQMQEMVLQRHVTQICEEEDDEISMENDAVLKDLLMACAKAKRHYLMHDVDVNNGGDGRVENGDDGKEPVVKDWCSVEYVAVREDWSLQRAMQYVKWRREQIEKMVFSGSPFSATTCGSGGGLDDGGDGDMEEDDPGKRMRIEDEDTNSIDLEMDALVDKGTRNGGGTHRKRDMTNGGSSTSITMVLVTDDERWRVMGHIRLLDLISYTVGVTKPEVREGEETAYAPAELLVRDVMEAIPSLDANEKLPDAAMSVMEFRSYQELPVTGQDGELIGMVSPRHLLEVYIHTKEFTSEGRKRFISNASTLPDPGDDNMNFIHASVFSLFVKRIVWLVLLIFVNLVSSGVIAAFENTLSKNISLAFFIPLLIGTGGNVGTQSSTLFIRALALNEINTQNIWRTILREFAVSLCLGVTLGIFGSLLGIIRGGFSIAIVISLTIACIVVLSDFVGTMLPFIFHAIRLDPAVAAGPTITTILDACGLLIYFGIAVTLLDVVQIGKFFGQT